MNQKDKKYYIKPYLKKRGFNLSAIATSMGMSFQSFSHHLKPKKDLSYNFVVDMSTYLKVSVEEFINEVSIKNSSDGKEK